MARRRRESGADVLFALVRLFPWWVGVILAVLTYAILHRVAAMQVDPVSAPGQMGPWAIKNAIKGAAVFGQYVLPIPLLIGAVASAFARKKRRGLFHEAAADSSGAAIRSMSWREFELLIGEAYRNKGYAVAELGGAGADGGVDLRLTRGREVVLVQCKQWKAFKVGVTVIRELYGVLASQRATGGIVVTSGVFTKEASNFADECGIELIDGASLRQLIDEARKTVSGPKRSPIR